MMNATDIPAPTAPATPKPIRLQFGLSTLLQMVLIASLAFLWVSAQTDVRKLRETNKALRNELGLLNIEDESLVHVRSIKRAGEGWRWRLYLPEKAVYEVAITTQGIGNAGDGIDMGSSQIHFPAGQFTVDVFPERDLKGNWQVKFTHLTGAFSIGGWADQPKFMDGNNLINGISGETLTLEKDATIELMRLQAMVPAGNGYVAPTGPSDGLLVRMKRVK